MKRQKISTLKLKNKDYEYTSDQVSDGETVIGKHHTNYLRYRRRLEGLIKRNIEMTHIEANKRFTDSIERKTSE